MRLPTVAFPTTLPLVKSYSQQILARSDLVGWWQADPAYVVAPGNAIGTMNNLKSGGPTFGQATGAAQPTLTASAIADFYAAGFDGGDFLACSDPLAQLAGPFTLALLVKMSTSASTQTAFSKRTDSSNRVVLDVSANSASVRGQIGSGVVSAPITMGSWALAVLASDGASVGKLRANGVNAADMAHNNAVSAATPAIGSLSSTAMSLGLAAGSQVSDLMVFSAYHPNAAGLLALIETYFVQTYALPFAPAT